ncbi:MAG: F0F1 ATP synthase subunit A [Chloroflexi bacterium]|nr:F0F1 ATP synthase subunit A [Chloroflexota bacterium]MBU1746054.1 F0F1 ATP synthase subunit A [Chloroflexota bacterium]
MEIGEFLPHVVFVIPVLNIPVRNTVVVTWIMMALIIGVAAIVGQRRLTALEMLVDFLNDVVSDVMGIPAETYLPLLGSLAIFIAVANVLGVIPFLFAPTRDINVPLALAVVVFFSVHYFGVRARGPMGYLKSLASPIFLLPLEIIGQLIRTLSLTMRLFGNIFSGELLVAIVFSLAPLIVPLPLIVLGMFIGVLQAYVFTVLAAVYIGAGLGASESGSSMEQG